MCIRDSFRAEDFTSAWNIITAMLTGFGEGEKVLGYFDLTKVFVLSGILFLTHYYMRHHTVRMVTSSAGPWPVSYTHLDVYKRQEMRIGTHYKVGTTEQFLKTGNRLCIFKS